MIRHGTEQDLRLMWTNQNFPKSSKIHNKKSSISCEINQISFWYGEAFHLLHLHVPQRLWSQVTENSLMPGWPGRKWPPVQRKLPWRVQIGNVKKSWILSWNVKFYISKNVTASIKSWKGLWVRREYVRKFIRFGKLSWIIMSRFNYMGVLGSINSIGGDEWKQFF